MTPLRPRKALRREVSLRREFAPRVVGVPADPNAVRPATREEMLPVTLAAVLLGFLALTVCISRGYLLLYGDAVAHLGIARRILDSRNPGLGQLGGRVAAAAASADAAVCAEDGVVA